MKWCISMSKKETLQKVSFKISFIVLTDAYQEWLVHFGTVLNGSSKKHIKLSEKRRSRKLEIDLILGLLGLMLSQMDANLLP